jgi:hypothetical protein
MIDPITALSAISSAVALVKKVSKTVDDVASLGPVLGKYFDAKEQAIKVVEKSKNGEFKGSALGKALELEMALEQAREFEEQVKMLFFQSNKMDVWMRITARAKQMEADAARSESRRKAEKKRKQDEIDELVLIIGAIMVVSLLLGLTGYFVLEALQRQGGL